MLRRVIILLLTPGDLAVEVPLEHPPPHHQEVVTVPGEHVARGPDDLHPPTVLVDRVDLDAQRAAVFTAVGRLDRAVLQRSVDAVLEVPAGADRLARPPDRILLRRERRARVHGKPEVLVRHPPAEVPARDVPQRPHAPRVVAVAEVVDLDRLVAELDVAGVTARLLVMALGLAPLVLDRGVARVVRLLHRLVAQLQLAALARVEGRAV